MTPWLLASFCLLAFAGMAQDSQKTVPRDIYTFWEGPRPDIMERCLRTWREVAPGWKIHVLSRSNMKDYAPELPANWEKLDLVKLSDLIRLEVLTVHGGVWLDATVALVEPLDTWVPAMINDNALIGFDLDFVEVQAKEIDLSGPDWASHFHANGSLKLHALTNSDSGTVNASARVFESWGFAAAAGCPALRRWRDEFRLAFATDGGLGAYCTLLKSDPDAAAFLHPSLRRWLPYLTVHATLARVRHRHPDLVVHTHPAESVAFAHLHYMPSWGLVRLQRPSNYILDGTGGAILALARGLSEGLPPPTVGWIMKLRMLERPAFESVVAYRGYAADSPLAKIFKLPGAPWLWSTRVMRYVAAFQAKFGATDDGFLLALFFVMRSVSSLMLILVRFIIVWGLLLMALVSWLILPRARGKKGWLQSDQDAAKLA